MRMNVSGIIPYLLNTNRTISQFSYVSNVGGFDFKRHFSWSLITLKQLQFIQFVCFFFFHFILQIIDYLCLHNLCSYTENQFLYKSSELGYSGDDKWMLRGCLRGLQLHNSGPKLKVFEWAFSICLLCMCDCLAFAFNGRPSAFYATRVIKIPNWTRAANKLAM